MLASLAMAGRSLAMAGRSKSVLFSRRKPQTISKSEYQMTKTFPELMQYLFQTFQDILCFEFRIWSIRICFGLPWRDMPG